MDVLDILTWCNRKFKLISEGLSFSKKAAVDNCSLCGKDLSDQKVLESSNGRIIEDIPDVIERPEVIKVEQEKKYCPDCKEVITAKSELALPKADIGLNSTILICYLWVALCLPFTRIRDYLKAFFGKDISTSGLSKHVIRVSKIMKDVYKEILEDINHAVTLHADETGWRVRGKNWWLWVFGTQESAYFTVDQSRGGSVVRRVLGEIFLGRRDAGRIVRNSTESNGIHSHGQWPFPILPKTPLQDSFPTFWPFV